MGRRFFSLALVAALAAACSPSKPKAILAVAVPLSGSIHAEGGGIVRAVELAVSEFNDSGILSQKIIVRAFDDEGTPDGAKKAAKKIISDPRVFAVIGHFTSDCSLAAAPIYASSGIPMITPSAANSVLTAQQKSPNWKWAKSVFRMPPTDLEQAKYAAYFARSRISLRSFWIIEDGSSYGLELSQAFGVDFKKLGGRILGFSEIRPDNADFSKIIRNLKRSKPQGLFFGGFYPEASRLLTSLRQARIKTTFFSGGASKEKELLKTAGEAANGAYFVISGVPVDFLPSANPFIGKYKALFKAEPRAYDVYAYEAAKIALDAFQKSGFDHAAMIEALRETKYNSMIGMIRFDDKGDDLNILVTMVRANYRKRKFEPAY